MPRRDVTLSYDEAMALSLLLAEAGDAEAEGESLLRHLGRGGPLDDRAHPRPD